MNNDDIRKQLEILRNGIRALDDSLVDQREEDLRMVYGDQIRPVLVERIDRFFSGMERERLFVADERKRLEDQLVELVDRTVSSFQRDGTSAASRVLAEKAATLSTLDKSIDEPRFSHFKDELIQQIREYFEIADRMANSMNTDTSRLMAPSAGPAFAHLSPQKVEETLGPLSNSLRIRVLLRLADEDDGLAALGRALGLKKGHLQFHLKSLLGFGYVRYDRKGRLYSITAKGTAALDGLAVLVDRLSSA